MNKDIYIKGRHITLNVVCPYHIALSEINTPEKVKWWIDHLSGKIWITPRILSKMVSLLEEHFGHDLHDFSQAG